MTEADEAMREKRRAQWRAASAKRRALGLAVSGPSGGKETNTERQRRFREKQKVRSETPPVSG